MWTVTVVGLRKNQDGDWANKALILLLSLFCSLMICFH